MNPMIQGQAVWLRQAWNYSEHAGLPCLGFSNKQKFCLREEYKYEISTALLKCSFAVIVIIRLNNHLKRENQDRGTGHFYYKIE